MKNFQKIISTFLSVLIFCTMTSFPVNSSAEDSDDSERIIVSLGDSYSSGEGIEDFIGEKDMLSEYFTKAKNDTEHQYYCLNYNWLAHRSENSWPGQLVLDGKEMVLNSNWYFEAVSGAETKHIGAEGIKSTPQKKEVIFDLSRNLTVSETYNMPYQMEVFDKLDKNGKKERIAYVTMTLSGNDVGFSDIITSGVINKAHHSISNSFKDDKNVEYEDEYTAKSHTVDYKYAYDTTKASSVLIVNAVTAQLLDSQKKFDNETSGNLRIIYKEVQEKAGEQAKIIVAGYPKLLNPIGSIAFTPEVSREINKNVSILNNKIKHIVDDCRENGLNIFFVSVEDNEYFGGHEAYTENPYINPIMLRQNQDLNHSKFPPVSDYSIHPNEKGAEVYAEAVQNEIDTLEKSGIISGHIYQNKEEYDNKTSNNPMSTHFKQMFMTKIKTITAMDTKTGIHSYGKIINPNTGYYEIYVESENPQKIEVQLNDGTSFWVNEKELTEDELNSETIIDTLVEVTTKSKECLRNINIDFEKQCLISENDCNFEWYLEPCVEADDINVVNECAFGANYGWFIQSDYSLIKRDGCYGVISNQGKIVVSPKYTRASGELGNHFILYLKDSPYDHYSSDMFCTRTNSVTPDSVNYCESCNVLSTTFYGSGYYYDENRKLLLSADLMSHKENYEAYMLGQNAQGLVNVADTVIARKAAFSTDHPDYKSNDTYKPELLFGIVKNNIPISKFIYDNATDFQDDIATLSLNGKWGYIDKDGQVLIPFEFDGDFVYEYSYETTRYNFDNETGETDSYNYITKEEKMAYLPSEGYIALNKGQNAGYYDIKGNEIVTVGTFAEARPVHNGKAWVKDKKTGLWGVISLPRTWQDIYKDKLSEYYNSDKFTNDSLLGSMFDLCDINDDGIPELFISEGIYTSANVRIYTAANNEIQELLRGGSYGELHINKECSYIMTDWIRLGYEQHAIYHFNDTDCSMIINLAGSYAYEDGTYENAEGYSINDVLVTKEEYLKQYKKYLDDIDWEFCGRKYNFDQIDEIL